RAGFGRKLGLRSTREDDETLARDFLAALQAVDGDFTLGFRALVEAAGGAPHPAVPPLPKTPAMEAWLARWRARLADEEGVVERLQAVNPAVIPRNHQVERALAAAAAGDLAPFEALLAAVRRPFDDGPAQQPFMAAPAPAERVTQTFCGT